MDEELREKHRVILAKIMNKVLKEKKPEIVSRTEKIIKRISREAKNV